MEGTDLHEPSAIKRFINIRLHTYVYGNSSNHKKNVCVSQRKADDRLIKQNLASRIKFILPVHVSRKLQTSATRACILQPHVSPILMVNSMYLPQDQQIRLKGLMRCRYLPLNILHSVVHQVRYHVCDFFNHS